MTVEEIRAAAEQRVAQMSPEEYERYAAQARADLELTETKLFYTLKGEERNRFLRARERLTGTGHRDPRTMSLRELRDRYGDLPENTVYGRKPHVMKTWIFVLLFFVCLTHWIPFAVIAEQLNNPWYDIFMTIFVIILLSAPGFFLMIVISAIRNSTVKRRILINSAAAIDKLRLEDETVRVIADQIRQKREEVAQMQEMREAIETRQKQEADFGSLTNGKYPAEDRTNAGQNSANDESQMINGKYPVIHPERKPVSALTEANLNRKLADIIDTNEGSRVFETETVTSPGQILLDRAGIEAEVKRRFEALSPEEYDVIAKPIREKLAVMRSAKKAGANAGKRNNSLLRDYQKASKDVDKMIYYGSKDHTLKESLSVYMISVDRIASGDVIAKGSFKAKNTVIYFGCIAVIIIYLATHSSIRGFESSLCQILGGGSFLASLYFLPRMIDDIKKASVIRRAVKYYGTPEGQEQEIKDRLKVMVYETEQMNHFRNAN